MQSAPHHSPGVGIWPAPSGSSVECRESGEGGLELVPRANLRDLFCPRKERHWELPLDILLV